MARFTTLDFVPSRFPKKKFFSLLWRRIIATSYFPSILSRRDSFFSRDKNKSTRMPFLKKSNKTRVVLTLELLNLGGSCQMTLSIVRLSLNYSSVLVLAVVTLMFGTNFENLRSRLCERLTSAFNSVGCTVSRCPGCFKFPSAGAPSKAAANSIQNKFNTAAGLPVPYKFDSSVDLETHFLFS